MLGFTNYGTRTIAMCKNNEEERKKFSEIYLLQISCSAISILLFLITISLLKINIYYMLLQSLMIFSCLFDVTWYFFGKEDYKSTVIRNVIIKIITIIAILLFIKQKSDLPIYILIMSGSTFISQFILWIIIKEKRLFIRMNFKNAIKNHLKEVVLLFIPLLAMSVYHIMDKTMLGLLSTNRQSGLYYNSDKIASIPFGILNGLGIVLLSKASSIQKEEKSYKKNEQLLNLSIYSIMGACYALSFGIASISKDFIPFFFGKGYDECIVLVKYFTIIISIKCLSNILRMQFMIPFKKEKELTFCVTIGAIVNLIINFVLLYYFKMGALGTTIGTLISEFVVLIFQIIITCKTYNIIKSIIKSFNFIFIGIIMYYVVKLISTIDINIVAKLLIEISIGGIIYIFISYIYLKLTNSILLTYLNINRRVKK